MGAIADGKAFIATMSFAALLAASPPAQAGPAPSPEDVLAEASRYTVKVQVLNDIAFNQDEGGSGSGTGFLIDRQRGWILTNAHVATRSPSTIRVSFKGGELIAAKRVHVDPLIDLAILSVPTNSIPASAVEAKLGCDTKAVSGTSVLAYGHPWGLSYSASRGIVSGAVWFYPNELIQTDAAINSGNSGGPLISLTDGRVIGINTSTYQPDGKDGSATAVSLAEPMPPICRVVELLKATGDASLRLPPFAIATSGDDLRPHVAQVFAANVGLEPGDIITHVNGVDVGNYSEMLSELRGARDGATLSADRGGKAIDVRVTTAAVPNILKVRAINLSGLIIAEAWKLDDPEVNPERNLIIDWYQSGEEAALTDAMVADYVVSVDGRRFSKLQLLYDYLSALPKDAVVKIIVKRPATANQFYREYRHLTISRRRLEWVTAQ